MHFDGAKFLCFPCVAPQRVRIKPGGGHGDIRCPFDMQGNILQPERPEALRDHEVARGIGIIHGAVHAVGDQHRIPMVLRHVAGVGLESVEELEYAG